MKLKIVCCENCAWIETCWCPFHYQRREPGMIPPLRQCFMDTLPPLTRVILPLVSESSVIYSYQTESGGAMVLSSPWSNRNRFPDSSKAQSLIIRLPPFLTVL